MKNSSIVVITAALFALPAFLFATHQEPQEIAKRAAPIGKVYRAGDVIEKAAVVAVAVEAAARSVEDIYKTCAGCHDTGAANAPIVGNKEQWAPRINKGMDTLVANAVNGFMGMPAKGLCMDCSDDEIKAVVELMLEKSQ